MTSTESGRRLHVPHIGRRLVEVLEQFLEQTSGKAFLRVACSYAALARLALVSRHGVLARPRHLLATSTTNLITSRQQAIDDEII